jgi:hypothetical protein
MGVIKNAYKIVGKPEGTRPLQRPTRRRQDNIKMYFMEIMMGICGLDASGSGYGPVADSCEHGNEPSGSIKVGEFID